MSDPTFRPDPAGLALLMRRTSAHATQVTEPAPPDAVIEEIVEVAMRAPDHGGLSPWRYLIIRGQAREALGELMASALAALKPESSEVERRIAASKPMRAPLILAVVACFTDHPKVPRQEQLLACGASATLAVTAAQALGYGASWLSGPLMYSPEVHAGLGLAENEELIGLIYVGTPKPNISWVRRRPDPSDHLSEWTGTR